MTAAPPVCHPERSEGSLKLPAGWRWTTVGEITASMKNGVYKQRDAYVDGGFACLRMYNIDEGRIVWRDIKRMKLTKEETCEYGLLPGDILVNRVNSRELVGKAAVIVSPVL
jgi:type I restriction enzyme S subunit